MPAPSHRRRKDQALLAARQGLHELRELLRDAEDDIASGVPAREISLRAEAIHGRVRIAVKDYLGLLP